MKIFKIVIALVACLSFMAQASAKVPLGQLYIDEKGHVQLEPSRYICSKENRSKECDMAVNAMHGKKPMALNSIENISILKAKVNPRVIYMYIGGKWYIITLP